ncbi:MAG: 50S ribosomal protein L7/L12 [Peptococcaceae bacterium]|nr:50S ribosomal protein L7/L12 [Peptococcaceae bacterium]MDR2737041.1 50S ribosomal protein L7/L12 [Gracilibacteraceae bacterium]
MSKIDDILGMIEGLTVLELSELSKAFEEKFGVTAAAPMVMAGAPAAGGGSAAAASDESEQTEFDVILTNVGATKMTVIKVVNEVTGAGLKGAKEIVDAVPKAIKEKVSRDEADSMKAKLEEAGATVEIK